MQSNSVKFQEHITRAYYRQFFTLHEGQVYVFALIGQKVLNFRPLPSTPEVRIVEKLGYQVKEACVDFRFLLGSDFDQAWLELFREEVVEQGVQVAFGEGSELIIKSSAELITADLLAAKVCLQAANARYREFQREVRQLAEEQDRGRDAVIAADLKQEILIKEAFDRLEV